MPSNLRGWNLLSLISTGKCASWLGRKALLFIKTGDSSRWAAWMFPLLCLSEGKFWRAGTFSYKSSDKQFENQLINYLVHNTCNYSGWWELLNKWWLWLYLKQIQATSFVHPPILFFWALQPTVSLPLCQGPQSLLERFRDVCVTSTGQTISLYLALFAAIIDWFRIELLTD